MTKPCLAHYWLLGDMLPGQPSDRQTCKLCGKSKRFTSLYLDISYQELQQRGFGKGREERPAIIYTARGRREV